MNHPLTKEQRAMIVSDLAELLKPRHDMTARKPRDSGDYAETDEGRKRRKDRRQAIARKREFLA